MPSSLLIADLHLVSGEVDKTNLFVRFCQEQAAQVDRLFILGDLFNTWLGDDLSNNAYQDVIQALKQLSSTTDVFVMDGNRDFLIGADFEKKSGAKLINEPYVLSHHDKKYVLIHGDSLCTDDVNYQKLKKVLRNPITTFIFTHLPKQSLWANYAKKASKRNKLNLVKLWMSTKNQLLALCNNILMLI